MTRMTSSLSSFDEDESLDFHTAPTNQHNRTDEPVNNEPVAPNSPLGSQEYPIDVDKIPEAPIPNVVPNDPTLDGFLHYLQHEVHISVAEALAWSQLRVRAELS